MTICLNCGSDVPQKPRGRRRLTCNRTCARKHRERTAAATVRPPLFLPSQTEMVQVGETVVWRVSA